MTKVEELRFNMLVMVKAYEVETCGDSSGAEAEVDSLIAAARLEGAAAERERIRQNLKQRGFKNEAPDGIEYWNIDEDSLFSLNLAPATKEEVKP